MAKKCKVSSLGTPNLLPCYCVINYIDCTVSVLKEGSPPHMMTRGYQFPSHQLELPAVLIQDSIASFESVDLEPIPQSIV
jgi:hypothetical protein